eukprot:TRINITY_DN1208_c0_g4_i1.p1 TRINITY_DN1208_c0_g4~~TRINITY_DN1208_c0_g4_i1.p1  ORF type:complete len:244 (+),score=41.89 TRINITY_DN1208_c0_g4_i1:336-1067(+)
MDVVITHANALLDAHVYHSATPTPLASLWSGIPLFLIMLFGAVLLYFVVATLDYMLFWTPEDPEHPKWDWARKEVNKEYFKGQIKKEIKHAMTSVPIMSAMTVPIYLAEFYGYSKVYYNFDDYSLTYTIGSVAWFFMFTDCGIYWIHRWLHHRSLYWIHAPHHAYIAPTPYASIAFHPIDGWAQALPYHLFVFLFPFNNWVYLGLFVGVQIWVRSATSHSKCSPSTRTRPRPHGHDLAPLRII